MKQKIFKKSNAKLPADEKTIGGDAPLGSENPERKREIKRIVEKVETSLKRKKA